MIGLKVALRTRYYNGDAGDDTLVISGGADTMSGGTGFDTILYDGDNANNTLDLSQAANTITVAGLIVGTIDVAAGDLERIEVDAGDGVNSSTLAGLAIPVLYRGGSGVDTVTGTTTTAAMYVLAGDGNDVISGGTSGDLIFGGTGDDILVGGGSETWFMVKKETTASAIPPRWHPV